MRKSGHQQLKKLSGQRDKKTSKHQQVQLRSADRKKYTNKFTSAGNTGIRKAEGITQTNTLSTAENKWIGKTQTSKHQQKQLGSAQQIERNKQIHNQQLENNLVSKKQTSIHQHVQLGLERQTT